MMPAAGARVVLGLVTGLGNSFWNVVVKAAETALLQGGYGVVLAEARDDPERLAHYESLLRSGYVAGLMLYGPPSALASRLLATDRPAAVLYGTAPESAAVPVFGVANREAAREMMRHLVDLGHRRIAHLAGPEDHVDARERLDGYRDGLAAAGLPYVPELVWRGDYAFVAGTRAAIRCIAMPTRPTAVFAASDEMAIGLISGLRDGGVPVPDALSVAGFDGTDLSAMYQPALTTILQPRAELGRLAAESILRRLAGAPPESGTVRLPCRLVVRQSVTPPPRGAPAPASA